MISGKTTLIAHLGYPTEAFKAPMIYNPWFESRGVDAVVVPMGVQAADYAATLAVLARMSNLRGALVTMPHKVRTLALVTRASPAARIAGACNALLKRPDGSWFGDQFDGAGFVRGVECKGRAIRGQRAIILGTGGVGSAIAASLAAAGAAGLMLSDLDPAAADALGARLLAHYPNLDVRTGSADPAGFDLVVNATPLGMREDDPLPFDTSRIASAALVGDVVMKSEITPFLRAARARGCVTQPGIDMLFEMIPAYLEFFGFPRATADELRGVAQVRY
ncbi:MAG: shikimate dehydrogenase [Caldimonas sp.]